MLADLRGTNLTLATLDGANLIHAELQNACLSYSRLQFASVFGANLLGADLQGAMLTNAQFDENTILPDGSKWTPESDLNYFTSGKYKIRQHLVEMSSNYRESELTDTSHD